MVDRGSPAVTSRGHCAVVPLDPLVPSTGQGTRRDFVRIPDRGIRVFGPDRERSVPVRKSRWIPLLALVGVLLSWRGAAEAQRSRDLTEFSLEELMRLDVVSINVLGSHIHTAGQWMLGYEYMLEDMDGNRNGTHRQSHTEVLRRFPTVPTKMRMQMHMPMLMYAPTDDLTLMGMAPYVRKVMDHVTRTGKRFTELSEGIGDLQLRGLATVYKIKGYDHRFLLNAGVSVPTGSIDKEDFGPNRALGRLHLEYPMQLGSGTVDVLPGGTYLGQAENWGWGAEMIPTIRLGENSNHYTLGNRYLLRTWASRKVTDWFGVTVDVDGQRWDNIRGADPRLDPTAAGTKDPKRQAGDRIDLLLGVNLYVPSGFFKGNRFAVEVGAPVYQRLDGPVPQTDWLVRVGWQWAFH